jgi:hypothetical protein
MEQGGEQEDVFLVALDLDGAAPAGNKQKGEEQQKE